jgi:hypothetical protein
MKFSQYFGTFQNAPFGADVRYAPLENARFEGGWIVPLCEEIRAMGDYPREGEDYWRK